jgi:LysR family transcriptional regulator, nitrogen assimilation regulatory protein
MRTKQLEYFVRICELGSITQAAAAMNIAQPALGSQISALEAEMGEKLLVRSPRGISLTAAGQVFLTEAKFLLRRVADLKSEVKRVSSNQRKSFRLGLPPSLNSIVGNKVARDVSAQCPGLRFKIIEGLSDSLVERTELGELDIAFAFSVSEDRQVERKSYFEESLYLISCPHAEIVTAEPIVLNELVRFEFAMPGDAGQVRRLIEDALESKLRPLNVRYEIESISSIKELIISGAVFGVLSLASVAKEVAAGILIARPIVSPQIKRTLYSIIPRSSEKTDDILNITSLVEKALDELYVCE